jgi:hypothetical protein
MAWKQEDELYALDHKKECMGNFIVLDDPLRYWRKGKSKAAL